MRFLVSAVTRRSNMLFVRLILVVVLVAAFGASAQGPDGGPANESGGGSQILVVTKYGRGEVPGEFILYRSGLVLFRTTAHAGEGLGWLQVRLNSKEKAAFDRLLQGHEFGALQPAYEVSATDEVGSYLICGVQANGHSVEVSIRARRGGARADGNDNVPQVLTRLFSLMKGVDGARATHWQPEWIDLGLQHETPGFPGPARKLPREWLIGAIRPEQNKVRVAGRYETAIHEFFLERQQTGGPAILDGDTFRVSMSAVLPGKEACPPRVVRIGAVPAERGPRERPPRR